MANTFTDHTLTTDFRRKIFDEHPDRVGRCWNLLLLMQRSITTEPGWKQNGNGDYTRTAVGPVSLEGVIPIGNADVITRYTIDPIRFTRTSTIVLQDSSLDGPGPQVLERTFTECNLDNGWHLSTAVEKDANAWRRM